VGNKVNVLVLQGELPRYRLPVFEQLASLAELDVSVLCGIDHTAGKRTETTPLSVLVTPISNLGPFRWHRGLWRHVRAADVLVVMFDARWLSCMVAALLFPRKTVLWGHGMGRSGLANRLRLFLARRAAAVLVYEEGGRAAFVQAGCDAARVIVAGNTVEVMNPQRKCGVRTQFLFVGRLQARKRINDLLQVFSEIQHHLPPQIGLTIVGEGDQRESLETMAARLGIAARVEFTGAIYDDKELEGHYARAIAYVSPGDVGLSVLHAFGHGVPVIAGVSSSHGPEVENISQDVNGLIYKDTGELGRILLQLSMDQTLAERWGRAALAHYQGKRTIRHMVEKFKSAIELAAPRSGG